jgi:hypothetical protein
MDRKMRALLLTQQEHLVEALDAQIYKPHLSWMCVFSSVKDIIIEYHRDGITTSMTSKFTDLCLYVYSNLVNAENFVLLPNTWYILTIGYYSMHLNKDGESVIYITASDKRIVDIHDAFALIKSLYEHHKFSIVNRDRWFLRKIEYPKTVSRISRMSAKHVADAISALTVLTATGEPISFEDLHHIKRLVVSLSANPVALTRSIYIHYQGSPYAFPSDTALILGGYPVISMHNDIPVHSNVIYVVSKMSVLHYETFTKVKSMASAVILAIVYEPMDMTEANEMSIGETLADGTPIMKFRHLNGRWLPKSGETIFSKFQSL